MEIPPEHRPPKSQQSIHLPSPPPTRPSTLEVREAPTKIEKKKSRKPTEGVMATASESLLSLVRFDSDVDVTREAARLEKEEEARRVEQKTSRGKKKPPTAAASMGAAAESALAEVVSFSSRTDSAEESGVVYPHFEVSHPMLHLANHGTHVVKYGCDIVSCRPTCSFVHSYFHWFFGLFVHSCLFFPSFIASLPSILFPPRLIPQQYLVPIFLPSFLSPFPIHFMYVHLPFSLLSFFIPIYLHPFLLMFFVLSVCPSYNK